MICPKCQFENREEAAFCRKCGSSLESEISCPNCEASNPPDSKDAGNLEDAAYACMLLQWCYFNKGDFGQVLSLKNEALQLLEQQFNLRWYVWTLCAVSLTYCILGCWNKSIEEGKKALKAAEEFGDNSLVSFAAMMLSFPYSQKGEMGQGIEYGMMAV